MSEHPNKQCHQCSGWMSVDDASAVCRSCGYDALAAENERLRATEGLLRSEGAFLRDQLADFLPVFQEMYRLLAKIADRCGVLPKSSEIDATLERANAMPYRKAK